MTRFFKSLVLTLTASQACCLTAQEQIQDLTDTQILHTSGNFLRIESAFTQGFQQVDEIKTNAVPFYANATNAPDWYHRGNSNFRSWNADVRSLAKYGFGDKFGCYLSYSNYVHDLADFGNDWGGSDYGYRFEEMRQHLATSCGLTMKTPGGHLSFSAGLKYLRFESELNENYFLNLPISTTDSVWINVPLDTEEKGAGTQYKVSASYYNSWYKARAELGLETAIESSTSITNNSGKSTRSQRTALPTRISAALEKQTSPAMKLRLDLGYDLWARSKDLPTTLPVVFNLNPRKNSFDAKLSATYQVLPRLKSSLSLKVKQGLTGGDHKGIEISDGMAYTGKLGLSYAFNKSAYLYGGVGFKFANAGTSTYEPDASVYRFNVDYGPRTDVQAWIGTGFKF